MSFIKTFEVTVTFSRNDNGMISDSDINSKQLREDIQKEIAEVCTRTIGTYQAQPGKVTEY